MKASERTPAPILHEEERTSQITTKPLFYTYVGEQLLLVHLLVAEFVLRSSAKRITAVIPCMPYDRETELSQGDENILTPMAAADLSVLLQVGLLRPAKKKSSLLIKGQSVLQYTSFRRPSRRGMLGVCTVYM